MMELRKNSKNSNWTVGLRLNFKTRIIGLNYKEIRKHGMNDFFI